MDSLSRPIRLALELVLTKGRTSIRPGDPIRDDEIKGAFGYISESLRASAVMRRFPSVRVKASLGAGRWSFIPWIAFLDERETNTTKSGVYCVILVRQDMSGVYLTMMRGVTEPKERLGNNHEAREWLKASAIQSRRFCTDLLQAGFSLDNEVDLRSKTEPGRDYEAAIIAHKFYPADALPEDADLLRDLDDLLDAYGNYLRSHGEITAPEIDQEAPPRNASTGGRPRSWVFQGNPRVFDVCSAVSELRELTWLVTRYRNEINVGDRVFIWQSGSRAGVVALATVLTSPAAIEDGEVERSFRLLPMPDNERKTHRVRLRVDWVFHEIITKQTWMEHEVLRSAPIITMPSGTNFPLSDEQADLALAMVMKSVHGNQSLCFGV